MKIISLVCLLERIFRDFEHPRLNILVWDSRKILFQLNLVTAELFENARFSDLKSVRSPVDQYLAQSTDQTNVSTVGGWNLLPCTASGLQIWIPDLNFSIERMNPDSRTNLIWINLIQIINLVFVLN